MENKFRGTFTKGSYDINLKNAFERNNGIGGMTAICHNQ